MESLPEDPRCVCGLPDCEALTLGGFEDPVCPTVIVYRISLHLARIFLSALLFTGTQADLAWVSRSRSHAVTKRAHSAVVGRTAQSEAASSLTTNPGATGASISASLTTCPAGLSSKLSNTRLRIHASALKEPRRPPSGGPDLRRATS